MKKRYMLDIEYDPETEEISYLGESEEGGSTSIIIGEVDLVDYFDDSMLSLVEYIYDVGEA